MYAYYVNVKPLAGLTKVMALDSYGGIINARAPNLPVEKREGLDLPRDTLLVSRESRGFFFF